MIRSAASGLIDFSKADRFDPAWHSHVAVAGIVAAEQYRLRALETSLTVHAALLSQANLTPESFKRLSQGLTEDFADYTEALYPWLPRTRGVSEQVLDLYKQYVGDPADPVLQARLAKSAIDYARRRKEVLAARNASNGRWPLEEPEQAD